MEILQKECDVLVTDVATLQDNTELLRILGKSIGNEQIAEEFITKITENFNFKQPDVRPKVAYLIWQNPYMAAGGDTFISEVLSAAVFDNFFADRLRYPEVCVEELRRADLIFLSSEPFPFGSRHLEDLKRLSGHQKIYLVDGEAFSWYGTHPAHCGNYYKNLSAELGI